MIHYHHWADTAVPATNSINYFEQVQQITGGSEDFYKFYLVPGGFHGSQVPYRQSPTGGDLEAVERASTIDTTPRTATLLRSPSRGLNGIRGP